MQKILHYVGELLLVYFFTHTVTVYSYRVQVTLGVTAMIFVLWLFNQYIFHIIHSELINLLICFWAFSEFPCKYAGQHIATIHMRKGNSDIFLTLVSFSAAKSDFKTHMLTLY